jgi:hypothetical protein
MAALSYPRRQRYQRLARAARFGVLALGSLLLAAAAASAGLVTVALVLVLVGIPASLRTGHWMALARRSAIGARSEGLVRNQLRPLEREGWQIHHSLRWTGAGDVDHVAVAPHQVGLAFAVETKTRTYTRHDVARIYEVAAWLVHRGAGWCRQGAIPILCLAGARGVERWEAGVNVVSVDRLVPLLRRLSGTTAKPGALR